MLAQMAARTTRILADVRHSAAIGTLHEGADFRLWAYAEHGTAGAVFKADAVPDPAAPP